MLSPVSTWIQTQGLKKWEKWSMTRVSMRMKYVLLSISVTIEHMVNYHQKIGGLWPPRPHRCFFKRRVIRVTKRMKHVLLSNSVTVEHLVNYHQKIGGLWPPRPHRCYNRCSYLLFVSSSNSTETE